MGIFFDTFSKRIRNLWVQANELDKPIHDSLSWTFGIIRGRGDFQDLQAHGIALASSIIIQHDTVPKIICGWDCRFPYNQAILPEYKANFPKFMIDRFPPLQFGRSKQMFDNHVYTRSRKYMDLHRSTFSISPYPYANGLGYRAKYLGIDYVTTSHAVISDIDTICTRPCVDYFDDEIAKDPNTFVLSSYEDRRFLSVGLCIYNMQKYRNIFKPYLQKMAWSLPHWDSAFVKCVANKYPEIAPHLNVRIFETGRINTERFDQSKVRANFWDDEKTAHWHAWKGDMRANPKAFLDAYDGILSNLENKIKEQLSCSTKK